MNTYMISIQNNVPANNNPDSCGKSLYYTTIHIPGNPKKYSCLIKTKMHNIREILKTEIFLDYQWADLNFDMSVLHFCCQLVETQVSDKRFEN